MSSEKMVKSSLFSSTPLIVIGLAMAFNLVFFGPSLLYKEIKAMVEKPDFALYPLPCIVGRCTPTLSSCFLDKACYETMICINKCYIEEPGEKIAACSYICEMTAGYQNELFLDVLNCFLENKCISDYPRDGICYGDDKDADTSLKSLDQVAGDWWVIKGLNCGEGDFPGGYDWYPCQHERFIKQSNGQWINNVTYCGGHNDNCISEMIVTVANVSVTKPGIVRHDYLDAPLAPQTEDWRIVSWPDQGDYMFMLWCGRLPVLEYNGGIILSRNKNAEKMPKKVLEEFKKVSKKYGIEYDKLCPSNNVHCPF